MNGECPLKMEHFLKELINFQLIIFFKGYMLVFREDSLWHSNKSKQLEKLIVSSTLFTTIWVDRKPRLFYAFFLQEKFLCSLLQRGIEQFFLPFWTTSHMTFDDVAPLFFPMPWQSPRDWNGWILVVQFGVARLGGVTLVDSMLVPYAPQICIYDIDNPWFMNTIFQAGPYLLQLGSSFKNCD